MKCLPLLAVLCHLYLAIGSPIAEPDADADADADADPYRYARSAQQMAPTMAEGGYIPQYNQVGGPGSNMMYQPGNAGMYTRGPPPITSDKAENMDGYGTLALPDDGNVMPMGGYESGNPGQYVRGGMPDIYNNLNNQDNFINLPLASNPMPAYSAPAPSTPIYSMPINNKGQMFTRSYSPIPNTRCSMACRNRPIYRPRPVCRPVCNVRPTCPTPQVPAIYGNTQYCRPRPIMCPQSGCQIIGGGGYNPGMIGGGGYNPGYYPAIVSGGASTLPATIQYDQPASTNCNLGGCGVQVSPCGSGGCSDTIAPLPYPFTGGQAQTLPAQIGSWSSGMNTPPCVGSGCNQAGSPVERAAPAVPPQTEQEAES